MTPLFSALRGSLLAGVVLTIFLYGCGTGKAEMPQQQASPLPVLTLQSLPAVTYREYTASLEGKVNVEIRPQVDGYLAKIHVDEGAYVQQGQVLFSINDKPYREQLSNNSAALAAAVANEEKARLEVEKLTPLVENNVVSDVQLKTAKSGLQAAKAAVAQARAQEGNAKINVGFTQITAPVSGYVGRIPFKAGSLVGRGEALPLTVLSDVKEVYAYFSMSEIDFLHFSQEIEGKNVPDKIRHLPEVELVLADNNVYTSKGKIETVEGQFDKTTGAISFRAAFPNTEGLLRSGATGKVRIPRKLTDALVIPAEATFEVQDKRFVFTVGDSNKVTGKPIAVSGKSGGYFFVDKGLKAGDRIVYAGLDRLRDGAVVLPQPVSLDSLIRINPL